MYKFKRIFKYIEVFFMMTAAKFVGLFVKRRKAYRDLWIVAERGSDARDNGYHFFKFLTREHPEINAVYIITKKSPDREKVAALGRVVNYGSFKHFLCFSLARVKVSTHIDGYSPDILFFYKFGKLFPDKSKKIFLQHGIIKSDLVFCHADRTDIDMFSCSAVPEFDFIDKTYGYKEDVLQLTGLCRFDALHKNGTPTRAILFMPTWRSTLRTCSRQTFLKSEYFLKYNSFINSKKLADLLEEYDYKLIFYPHFEVQRFLDCFTSPGERVVIAGFDNYDVQQLLINTDILITDYSSVFFDYGYMRKPVVYYQYDEAAFYAEQYDKGYFDDKRDGFGKVLENEDDVVDELRHILENGLKPDDLYLDRINAFFKYSDANNCKRNFEAILHLLG